MSLGLTDRRRQALTIGAIALRYFVAGKLGLLLAFDTHQVTTVWPPSGIALAAFLIRGPWVWPGVFLGAFAVNATLDEPLWTAALIAAGNTAAPLLGALLLRRFGVGTTFRRLRDVLALVFVGAFAAMALSATNGAAQLALAHRVTWSQYLDVWFIWWMGDAMGVLLVTPLLLTWGAVPLLSLSARKRAEAIACFVVLGVCAQLIFSAPTRYQVQYAAFPLLSWVALRIGVRETTAAVAFIALFAVWGTIHGGGPFSAGPLDERLVLMEIFLAVAAVAGLSMAVITAGHQRAEAALRQAHDQLEHRVRERTAGLATANGELARKNEEVEAFVYSVSHDLRAPLVNMQGFARELELSLRDLGNALGQAALPAEVARRVEAIVRDDMGGSLKYIGAGAGKLERLIDALLQLSRSGREGHRREPVDVEALVDATLSSLRKTIEDRGATVSVARPLPRALGDPTAIEQVFSNLITNALHYLQPDRPGRIEIGAASGAPLASYWVRDNGVGLSPTDQLRLFQVFQRFHPDLAAGEGMGLAIVKRVVERHGGRIWADSVEGAGTTFHLHLPAATQHVHPEPPRAP